MLNEFDRKSNIPGISSDPLLEWKQQFNAAAERGIIAPYFRFLVHTVRKTAPYDSHSFSVTIPESEVASSANQQQIQEAWARCKASIETVARGHYPRRTILREHKTGAREPAGRLVRSWKRSGRK